MINAFLNIGKEILGKLKSLQVDPTEYACLKGIVLFKTGKYG
jgi:hypothetical protein